MIYGQAARGAVAPQLELRIELDRTGAQLGRADLMAAEFLDDLGDFARGDALHIHLLRCAHPCGAACGWLSPCGRFSHRKGESLLTAHAALQRALIEVDAVTHIRDAQLDSPHARGEGFGLEAIGMTESPFAVLIGLGLQHGRAFLVHGLIAQKAEAFGKVGGALRGEELQNSIEEVRFLVVGHV